MQDQIYTYTMFDVVGLWLVKHILGDILLPDQETMDQDWRRWVARNQKLANCHEQIDFQTDFVTDLAKDCGEDFPYNLDVADIFRAWAHHKAWVSVKKSENYRSDKNIKIIHYHIFPISRSYNTTVYFSQSVTILQSHNLTFLQTYILTASLYKNLTVLQIYILTKKSYKIKNIAQALKKL